MWLVLAGSIIAYGDMNKAKSFLVRFKMKSKNSFSSLPALSPVSVLDVATGEILSATEWEQNVDSLLDFVLHHVEDTWESDRERVLVDVSEYSKTSSAEFGRQRGYLLPTKSPGILAYSRVQKLYQHKLISEVSSWAENTSPNKGDLTFIPKMNLGATDSQMATLAVEGDSLFLDWKCWNRRLLFEFKVPHYILNRNISKWCLPTVQHTRKNGIKFYFAIQEKNLVKSGKHRVGIDLGKVEPYTAVVVNSQGARIASYAASKTLKNMMSKRDMLLKEKRDTFNRVERMESLGLDSSLQRENAALVRDKATRIGAAISHRVGREIVDRLKKHEVKVVNMEDLSWVRGKTYGGRWNHSMQQESIQHKLSREGVTSKKVSAQGTSQHCHICGTKLVHNTSKRTVRCIECQTTLDRDFNAAMNISKNQSYPTSERESGSDCTVVTTEVVREKSQRYITLARMLT